MGRRGFGMRQTFIHVDPITVDPRGKLGLPKHTEIDRHELQTYPTSDVEYTKTNMTTMTITKKPTISDEILKALSLCLTEGGFSFERVFRVRSDGESKLGSASEPSDKCEVNVWLSDPDELS